MNLTSFEIDDLFGKIDVKISISNNRLILIGPNGSGKSTILNCLYYILSRQWSRLREINFRKAKVTIDSVEYEFIRDEIDYLVTRTERGRYGVPPRYVDILKESGLFEEFVSLKDFDSRTFRRYSDLLRISSIVQLKRFQRDLRQEITPDLYGKSIKNFEKLDFKRILFLPTYRRIERELHSIFPQVEDAFRRYAAERDSAFISRRSKHYLELVNFGMQDVTKLIDAKLSSVKEFSRNQLNNLAGSYLTDVIRDKPENFQADSLMSLDEEKIDDILRIVDDKSLSGPDKEIVKAEIISLSSDQVTVLNHRQKYLAYFFSSLMKTADLLRENDVALRAFAEICNEYLEPDKYVNYDDVSTVISIVDSDFEELDIKDLSSGEKQVISLFSHLHLDAATSNIVVIDEPELSLSVPWQQTFLPDILATDKCSMLLAVTHSPFIYDNELMEYTVDVHECTKGAM